MYQTSIEHIDKWATVVHSSSADVNLYYCQNNGHFQSGSQQQKHNYISKPTKEAARQNEVAAE